MSAAAARALLVLGGMMLAASALAQNAAPAAPLPQAAAPRPDPIEARITYLHSRLRITKAQEPLWSKLAQAIRDNAKAAAPLLRQRMQAAMSGTAIDILNSYESLGEAQLEGVKKFAAAFAALYAGLSPAQKKIADVILRQGPLNMMVGSLPAPPPAAGLPYVVTPTPVPNEPVALPQPYPLYEPYYYGPDFVGPIVVAPHEHLRAFVPPAGHLQGFHR